MDERKKGRNGKGRIHERREKERNGKEREHGRKYKGKEYRKGRKKRISQGMKNLARGEKKEWEGKDEDKRLEEW